MLTTIYKSEDGQVVSLHLHAQTETEQEELAEIAASHEPKTEPKTKKK